MSFQHFLVTTLPVAAFSVTLALCGAACNSPAPATGPDAVAARVNKAELTLADLSAGIPANLQASATSEMKQDWVQQWVQSELLYQEAVRQELNKDRNIARELQKMQRDYLANVLLDRYLSQQPSDVSDGEIRAFYATHQREFVRQDLELKLSVIVLKEERAATDVWRALTRRPENFAELARDRSIDTETARNGGELGFLKKDEINNPSVQKSVFALETNQLSKPIKTETGYCIFTVTDRHEIGSFLPLDEIRADIVNRVLEERRRNRIKQLMDSLRKSSNVEVNRQLIDEPPTQKSTGLSEPQRP